MGHRANYVMVEHGTAKAYVHHWGALGCLAFFADGPQAAVDAMAEAEETAELLDWAFAEGGYLIDFDQQLAICFGPVPDMDEFADVLDGAVEAGQELHELAESGDNTGDEFADQLDEHDTWDELDIANQPAHPQETPRFPLGEPGLSYLQTIAPAWTGWRLIWDERGVDAFAEHLRSRKIAGIACQPDSHTVQTSPSVTLYT